MDGWTLKQIKRMLLGIALIVVAPWTSLLGILGVILPFVLVPAGLILVLVGFFGRDGPGYY